MMTSAMSEGCIGRSASRNWSHCRPVTNSPIGLPASIMRLTGGVPSVRWLCGDAWVRATLGYDATSAKTRRGDPSPRAAGLHDAGDGIWARCILRLRRSLLPGRPRESRAPAPGRDRPSDGGGLRVAGAPLDL